MTGYPWYSELGNGEESQGDGIDRRAGSGSSAAGGGLNSSRYAFHSRQKNPPVSADEPAWEDVVCCAKAPCSGTTTTTIRMPKAIRKRRIAPPWVEEKKRWVLWVRDLSECRMRGSTQARSPGAHPARQTCAPRCAARPAAARPRRPSFAPWRRAGPDKVRPPG